MCITGARKLSECEKVLTFVTRFWKLKKNLPMDFELMVSLCIVVYSSFTTFDIWVAQDYYCHSKKCIKFYMPNRHYLRAI